MGYLGKEIRNHVIVCLGIFPLISGGCHGRDCTVVGTTCVFSAYHHYSCEFKPVHGEMYSIQHYVIKLSLTCARSVVFFGFLHRYN
jgi:hypothetical protein